ncbi:hypothetical protein EST38_g9447 [Candolleomyces aberdarensis]|uniref:MFS general substrate transporter n=1 Tax=Candolleomyces aberdarensis TaxID=2316362 RepID=A0A4Q2DC40_9AGAR|nr:hypothetical protein EST38_g9447 [Candolleomyces aberdarensis]
MESSVREEKFLDVASDTKVPAIDSPQPPSLNSDAERRLLRKLDWILLPLFTAIWMEKDLQMKPFDLNIALTVFYICYCFADIPSNLALKHFGSVWLALLVIGFGIVTLLSAFLRDTTGLLVNRAFLGFCEGGTLYYRRHELVLRVGILFGVSPGLAGAFGGLLASGLLKLPDMGIVTSWRKIFLIEGLITLIFGLLLLVICPEDPNKSRILNREERALAIARIDADQVVKTQGQKEKTTLRLVLRSFNSITISCTVCYFMLNMSFQGLSLFMPTVIRSLSKTGRAFNISYSLILPGTVEVQLRTVPPYVASGTWVIINAYISARIKKRFISLVFNTMLMAVGYILSVATKNPHARYAACFLIMMGASVCGPVLLTWGTDNAAPDTMKAVVTAAIPGFGALGAILAAWTYSPTDAPDYRKGNLANLSSTSAVCVIVSITAAYIYWENKKRERGERDHRLAGKTGEELLKLGYRHPQFRYQI